MTLTRGSRAPAVRTCAGKSASHAPTPTGTSARQLVAGAREHGVFLRETTGMGPALDGDAWVRTAVRGPRENARIVQALRTVLGRS